MLSEEDLARIVKNELEDEIEKDEISTDDSVHYYILLDGKIYPRDDYDVEVAEGKRSPNDIYAYVDIYTFDDFDVFLLYAKYLHKLSVRHVAEAYLRKNGFTITSVITSDVFPPTPNLKYFIYATVEFTDHTPEYLVIDIYDIDSLARSFHIPQIVEQRLGNKPREITSDEFSDINELVVYKQHLLAGYTYDDALYILLDYYVNHSKLFEDEAFKISLIYLQLFLEHYQVCYEWNNKTQWFLKIDCLKPELLKRPKRSS